MRITAILLLLFLQTAIFAQSEYRYCLQMEEQVNISFVFTNAKINDLKYDEWQNDSTYTQLINKWENTVINFINNESSIKVCPSPNTNNFLVIITVSSVDSDGETYAIASLIENKSKKVIDSEKLNPNGGSRKPFKELWLKNGQKISKLLIKYLNKFRESY